jgi:hypothetical protein
MDAKVVITLVKVNAKVAITLVQRDAMMRVQ